MSQLKQHPRQQQQKLSTRVQRMRGMCVCVQRMPGGVCKAPLHLPAAWLGGGRQRGRKRASGEGRGECEKALLKVGRRMRQTGGGAPHRMRVSGDSRWCLLMLCCIMHPALSTPSPEPQGSCPSWWRG